MKGLLFHKRLLFHIIVLITICSCTEGDIAENKQQEELPDYCVVDNIDGWTKVAFLKDGSTVFVKNDDQTEIQGTMLAYTPNDVTGVTQTFVRFDENSIPQVMTFNEYTLFVDRYYDNKVDITLLCGDSIMLRLDSLDCELSKHIVARSFSENNGVRNIAAIGQAVCGAINVGAGLTTIGVSIVGSSGGVTIPASVSGIMLGVSTTIGGFITLSEGLSTLFAPGSTSSGNSDYNIKGLQSSSFELLNKGLEMNPGYDFMLEHYPEMARKHFNPVDSKFNVSTFWAEFIFSTMDAIWGETISKADAAARLYKKYKVVTGTAIEITQKSATLLGYVYPETTRPNGEKVSNDYGIVLVNGDEKTHKQITNGDGGLIKFRFTDLKKNTTYQYLTYYYDRTYKIIQTGKVLSFTTLDMPVRLSDVKATDALYHPDHYTPDGYNYTDFIFYSSVTATLTDSENVEDWGYYFVDPQSGESLFISLAGMGNSYTDTRYVYYRNEPNPVIHLGGYVKYFGDEKRVLGEAEPYVLNYPEDRYMTFVGVNFTGTSTGEFYDPFTGEITKHCTTSTALVEVKGAYHIQNVYPGLSSSWVPSTNPIPVYDGTNEINSSLYYDETNGVELYYKGEGVRTTNSVIFTTNGDVIVGCYISGNNTSIRNVNENIKVKAVPNMALVNYKLKNVEKTEQFDKSIIIPYMNH